MTIEHMVAKTWAHYTYKGWTQSPLAGEQRRENVVSIELTSHHSNEDHRGDYMKIKFQSNIRVA